MEGWTYRELGSLCTIKGRIGFRGYTRDDLVDEGKGAITLSPSNIIDDKLDLSKCSYISWFKYEESPEIMVYKGDIIYAKTASIGKVAIIDYLPEKATINPQFVVLKEIKCNNKYLYYALRSDFFRTQAASIVRGVAIPTLSQANLSLLTVPVPSLEEQSRIVSELDLLSGIIDKQKQQLKELDTLAQSMFYDMFGDPVTNEKGWEVRRLGDECLSVTYGTSLPSSTTGDYVYLRMNNITYKGALDLSDVKYIDVGVKDFEKYSVKEGDILFNRTNSADLVGKTTYFHGLPPMIIAGYIIRVRVKETLSPVYVSAFMNTKEMKAVLKSMGKGAVNQSNINSKELQSILIPIPTIDLQNSYTEMCQAIEKQKESIQSAIEETQKLFDYTMDMYFS